MKTLCWVPQAAQGNHKDLCESEDPVAAGGGRARPAGSCGSWVGEDTDVPLPPAEGDKGRRARGTSRNVKNLFVAVPHPHLWLAVGFQPACECQRGVSGTQMEFCSKPAIAQAPGWQWLVIAQWSVFRFPPCIRGGAVFGTRLDETKAESPWRWSAAREAL